MPGAFQVGPFQDGVTFAFQQVQQQQAQQGPTPAGRGKAKRRYYVEIDGQRFDVDGPAQAQELLQRARALAEKAADAAAQQVVEKRKPERRIRKVTLLAPKVAASPELGLDLAPFKRDLIKIYENAAVLAELQLLLRAQEDDDEDAMLWLM